MLKLKTMKIMDPFTLIIILLAFHPSSSAAQINDDLELVQVQILSRHGHRAPEFPYPTDAYQNVTKYWPNGWGQLTELGKEQEFELGQFVRKRYGTFLSETFSAKEVFALSSDYERTIQSAQLVLAGLFSRKNEFDIDSIIPTHSIPAAFDRMINPNPACPRRKMLYDEFQKSEEVTKHYENNKVLYENLLHHMGYGANETFGMFNSLGSLMIYRISNMSIPTWAADVLDSPDFLPNVSEVFRFLSGTDTLKRLTTGPLLADMVDKMKGPLEGSERPKKLLLYLGHDLTLANMINTLSTFEIWPTFSATLFFELYWKATTKEHFLRLHYKNSTTSESVHELNLTKCPSPCTLRDFKTGYHDFLPTSLELDVECSLNQQNSLSILDAVLIGVIVGLVAVMLILIFCAFCRSPIKAYSVNT